VLVISALIQILSGVYDHDLDALRLPKVTLPTEGAITELDKVARLSIDQLVDISKLAFDKGRRLCFEAIAFGLIMIFLFASILHQTRRSMGQV
jgi:hypothetical protein